MHDCPAIRQGAYWRASEQRAAAHHDTVIAPRTAALNSPSREGSGGRLNFVPTSMVPGGATRRPSAATARPADTAAPVVAMPPPTNTSVQGIPADFSASIAMLRTLQG